MIEETQRWRDDGRENCTVILLEEEKEKLGDEESEIECLVRGG
jgi:hypothetical protein